jgi:hypothetical protein
MEGMQSKGDLVDQGIDLAITTRWSSLAVLLPHVGSVDSRVAFSRFSRLIQLCANRMNTALPAQSFETFEDRQTAAGKPAP